ncbi:hypothetical protein [Bradyrhizobium liaoningense]
MFVTSGHGLSPESVRWQLGYCHGEEHRMPQFPDDADYASGWSHGHNSVHQCSMEVSEAIFFELRLRVGTRLNDFAQELVTDAKDA